MHIPESIQLKTSNFEQLLFLLVHQKKNTQQPHQYKLIGLELPPQVQVS